MKKLLRFEFIIPAAIVLVIALLVAFRLTDSLESKIFDGFLHVRAAPHQNSQILLVDVDDQAAAEIGTFPISRHITAEALMLLAELGTKYAVFDIEYVNKSPRGVNSELLSQQLPAMLDSQIGAIQSGITDLFGAVAKGQLSVRDAGDYVKDLVSATEERKAQIKTELAKVARDNDQYLAQAVHFFGNAFLTVNMQLDPVEDVTQELRDYATSHFALKNVEDQGAPVREAKEIVPLISPIIDAAKGIGFTNVETDGDGLRRKIELVKKYKNFYFPQLAFAPLLNYLGSPKLELRGDSITLVGAKMPDGSTQDIRIPIAQDGRIFVDWPHTKFYDSFKHISLRTLYLHDQLFADLANNIHAGEKWDYFHGHDFAEQVTQIENLRQAILEGSEDQSHVADYRAMRDKLISEFGAFLETKPDETYTAQLNQALSDKRLDAQTRQAYEQILADIPGFFKSTRSVYDNLSAFRKELVSKTEGSFAIIGDTSTGSTDLGITPFQSQYPNVGTHASVANMILNNRFVSDVSPLWSILLGLVISVLASLFVKDMKPQIAIATGLGIFVAIVLLLILFFVITSLYVPVIPVAASVLLSFIAVTFIQFFNTEKEKGFLRNAFSHYLSPDVIKEIVANPESLKLGGQEKYMTAMFTDIKGFSTISEKLTPEDLVNLLNQYLTAMSDLVMEMKGTIDKYEGDAIIAFFGAPISLEDHAQRACLSAVRMKRLEGELNKRFMAEGTAPNPLQTRIGLNSGNMIVGNMGTVKKMDYTVIGDSVNLAARLEGVNKQYDSWICAAEDTVKHLGDLVVTRRLDRIRVVGKSVPIRIYELLEEPHLVDDATKQVLEIFNKGMDQYETQDWKAAAKTFESALKISEADGPSARFLKRCKEFIVSPPPANWDGVYSMTTK